MNNIYYLYNASVSYNFRLTSFLNTDNYASIYYPVDLQIKLLDKLLDDPANFNNI